MTTPQNSTKKLRLIPKQKLFLETFIKKMGHITDTCKEIKIDRKTYYNWLESDVFKNKLDESMEHFNDSVQRRILKLAMKDDKDMLKFWAKNLMKHRGWVERQEIEHSGEMQPHTFNLIVKSEEEIKREKSNNQPKTA